MKDPNFYAAGGLDRAGHRRKDAAWLAERLVDPSSRFVPVWRNQSLVISIEGAAPQAAFLAREEIVAEGETALLGLIGDCAYFAVDLST
ncbi:MAG TPA: NUDIX-like domain-containing protein, partial [Stellaceae bacterium]